jgi:hypothetical protein
MYLAVPTTAAATGIGFRSHPVNRNATRIFGQPLSWPGKLTLNQADNDKTQAQKFG